jgi:hypothetical protein
MCVLSVLLWAPKSFTILGSFYCNWHSEAKKMLQSEEGASLQWLTPTVLATNMTLLILTTLVQ